MVKRVVKQCILGTALACAAIAAPAAQAQDFFSRLFGGFGRGLVIRMPFDDGGGRFAPAPRVERQRYYSGGQAWCVRTCDGRYFPLTGADGGATCNNFCPAAETKVVHGSNIDDAATENGKPYSELPNAFRYRNEIVAGCSCNGKDPVGLAQVKIEDDPTLRKGDIVAGKHGLMVATRADRRGAELNFTPAPERIRAKYQRPPVVAQQ
jgi:hypothetical protein